jgi:glutaredoxin
MVKQLIFVTLIFAAIFGTVFLLKGEAPGKEADVKGAVFEKEELVYYYGSTCPHCSEVSAWIEAEKIKEKLPSLKKREVYQNEANNKMLEQAAIECGLDPTAIGVPFVYDNGKCYVGSIEAKEILKKKSRTQK